MDGSKTVTRRTGWANLQPGMRLLAVRKAMGLKAGEKMQALCEIEVVSVRRVTLDDIDAEDCAREGFPHFSPADFIGMFAKHMNLRDKPEVMLTRIEFRKVPGSECVAVQESLAL